MRLAGGLMVLLLQITVGPALTAQTSDYSGQTASGAWYRIVVPTGWQPDDGLVIWNHGYQGYTSPEPEPAPSLGPLENEVLSAGFALAASSYSQTGWAVFSSHIDNQQLYQRFVELAGEPARVYVQGASLGGIVTVRDLEAGLIPNISGALLMCGATAGSRNWYNAIDLRVIYEAVCEDAGNADLPTDSWYEIPDPLVGEFQFLRSLERCTGLLSDDLFKSPWASLLQTRDQRERLDRILQLSGLETEFLPLVLGYAVFELPRLVADESKLAGVRPFSNAGIDYGDEIINRSVYRSIALPSARNTLLENYSPSGAIGDTRIVAIHTSRDGLVPVANQQFFRELVNPDQISTAVVVEDEPSHCGFNYPEGLAAWQSLLAWTDNGNQPDAASLQNTCLNLSGQADQCRFNPGFEPGSDPVRFSREIARITSGTSLFMESTGELNIQGAQIVGESPLYDITLQLNSQLGLHFDVTDVSGAGTQDNWQFRANYFPTAGVLYLPGLQATPARPGSNRFDVFLKYFSEDSREWLQLLEYEEIPTIPGTNQ